MQNVLENGHQLVPLILPLDAHPSTAPAIVGKATAPRPEKGAAAAAADGCNPDWENVRIKVHV